MLIAEARAIGNALRAMPDDAFPIANVGSQSADFRTRTQPWIDECVFEPLSSAGHKVINVDLTLSDGVDVVADISTPTGRQKIQDAGARSVLCSNLLEHVNDPVGTLGALAELVMENAYLVVSGPLRYPHHPDPIDNGFRPTAAEVAQMLPDGYRTVHAADVQCRRLIRYDMERVRAAVRDRDRQHSAAPEGHVAEPRSARRLAARLGWTMRRPSCYLVVAHRAAATTAG